MTTGTKASNAAAARSGESTKTDKTTKTSITPAANRKHAKEPAAKGSLHKLPAAPAKRAKEAAPAPTKAPSRLATIVSHLEAPAGGSMAELCAATGWQAHSIRGAIAGALKRRGHVVTTSVVDGVRRYKIAAALR